MVKLQSAKKFEEDELDYSRKTNTSMKELLRSPKPPADEKIKELMPYYSSFGIILSQIKDLWSADTFDIRLENFAALLPKHKREGLEPEAGRA
jgi:hypothetical protein